MDAQEARQRKIDRVARELGVAIRRQVGDQWSSARTARRRMPSRHVWRIRAGAGEPDRFLSLSHQAMAEGENPSATLIAQLKAARWLDRIRKGPETSFRLDRRGRLRARPVA